MDIQLRPAQDIPRLFEERLSTRTQGESASITTFSIENVRNELLANYVLNAAGLDVLAVDYYGYLHGSVVGMPSKSQRELKQTFPGNFIILNRPEGARLFNGTFLKRSHIKAYTVGNKVLSLGGVNCTPYSFENTIDLMADFESGNFIELMERLWQNGGDLRHEGPGDALQLDSNNQVLIDYGVMGYSPILQRVQADLSVPAQQILFSSTYVPSGRVDELLFRQLKNGCAVQAYANSPDRFSPPNQPRIERYFQWANARRAKTPWSNPYSQRFNHLKAIVITYDAETKVAYLGSHNFHNLAVKAGHAEVCLRTTDPSVINDLENFMTSNLAGDSTQADQPLAA